ncbi:MAG: hypothetical protein D6772_17245 [Bacteroidetes bacterium]|nr:MAG: hypothetical protein D6772_17245 [Bacteroidota bacterium]
MKGNIPSRKKIPIPVRPPLAAYLKQYGRAVRLPLQYHDLLRYDASVSLLNHEGEDTYWETVFFSGNEQQEIYRALTHIYALLKTDGDMGVLQHLTINRIDYCTFGNTKPFRIRIINRLNDNYDHFYIKRADASRVYGLELEELLSPNSFTFLYDGETLVEEHIAGIPGDDFIAHHLNDSVFNQIRIAKEFVKFNERCFVRLLGDMRSYNYVVDITPDIEGSQFRLRAIDFDQQSYEGNSSFYQPKYFKENNPIIFLGREHMSVPTMIQYQMEERSLIAARIRASKRRTARLFKVMQADQISSPEKVEKLKQALAKHHKTTSFDHCRSMGDIVLNNLMLVLSKDFKQSTLAFDE